jgi:malate dehydrogenase (oxaloacetate-decarboxylating)(NADP+)
MRSDTTLIGCMLLRRGDGDALVCGTTGATITTSTTSRT